MARYSEKLIKRICAKAPKEGYCAICREYKKLTRDHVPPKGCNNSSDMVMSTFDEYNKNPKNPRGVTARSGTKFKTLCDYCNNDLLGGNYDLELKEMANRVTSNLPRSRVDWETGDPFFSIEVQPHKIARAVIGHLLAACAFEEITRNTDYPIFPKTLQQYFMSPSDPLPEQVDVFFWVHPYNKQEIFKHLGRLCINRGNLWLGHLIKFNPLGFLVTWNATQVQYEGVYPLFVDKTESVEVKREIKINRRFCPHKNFPMAVPDDSTEMTLSPEGHELYSTPKITKK